ncbi:MAG: phosphatidate cytidylyltransferase [Dongiaceae bacterium]
MSITAVSVDTVPAADPSALSRRLIVAAVLMPVALGLAWAGGLLWAIAITGLAGLALWEWQRMTIPDGWITTILAPLIAAGGCLALFIEGSGAALLVVAIAAIASVAVATRNAPLGRRLLLGAGVIYIGLGALALVLLRLMPEAGFAALFWLLFSVWASDSGAYAAGKLIGGPRLAPRISPNKTWAGLAGAMAAPAIVGVLFGLFWPGAPAAGLLGLTGLGIGLVGQAGDLTESAIKRHVGVKDSGWLVPGHGGVLDRIDALLAAALFVAAIYLFVGDALAWS